MSSLSSPSAAFGPCNIEFLRSVDYELPSYLFPELLPKVDEGGAQPIETSDAVISALDLARSSWPVIPIESLDDIDPARNAASSSSNHFDFARLVMQGAFTPIQLNAAALDASSGFSKDNVVRGVRALVQKLALGAQERSRSLIGRPLTPAEISTEGALLARVMMSQHFINVLAWQRLQELLLPASINDRLVSAHDAPPVSNGATTPLPSSDDATMPQPSIAPWDTEYSDCCISRPEELTDSFLEQLAQHFDGVRQKKLVSCGQQTDDNLRKRCAGVIRITSPYADSSKLTGPLPSKSLASLSEDIGSSIKSLRDPRLGAAVWEITVHGNNNTVDTLYLADVAGGQITFGRDKVGFSAASRAFIGASLANFTEYPKLISPLHVILSTSEGGSTDEGGASTTLNVTACGRNGVRIVGRRHLLAGQTASYNLPSTSEPQPLYVRVTPDVSIVIGFRPASKPIIDTSLVVDN